MLAHTHPVLARTAVVAWGREMERERESCDRRKGEIGGREGEEEEEEEGNQSKIEVPTPAPPPSLPTLDLGEEGRVKGLVGLSEPKEP